MVPDLDDLRKKNIFSEEEIRHWNPGLGVASVLSLARLNIDYRPLLGLLG